MKELKLYLFCHGSAFQFGLKISKVS